MSAPQPLPSRLIGALFVERGLVSESQIRIALEIQNETGQQLGQILVERFGVSRRELASVVAEQWAKLGGSSGPEDTASWRRLGDIFVDRGFVTHEELEGALARQRQTGERLGEALVAQGVISKFELAGALAEQMAALEASEPEAADDVADEATVHHLQTRSDEPSDTALATVLELVPHEQNGSGPDGTLDASANGDEHSLADEAPGAEPELDEADGDEHLDVGVVDEAEEPRVEDVAVAEPELDEADGDEHLDVGDVDEAEETRVEDVAVAEPERVAEHVGLAEPTVGEIVAPEPVVEDIVFLEPVADEVAAPALEVACVAFAPTTRGYRLVPLDSVPASGETIDVPDVGPRLVLRVGRSPYPLDDRICAFVEEPVTPALTEPTAAL
jgi:hypothetical protein